MLQARILTDPDDKNVGGIALYPVQCECKMWLIVWRARDFCCAVAMAADLSPYLLPARSCTMNAICRQDLDVSVCENDFRKSTWRSGGWSNGVGKVAWEGWRDVNIERGCPSASINAGAHPPNSNWPNRKRRVSASVLTTELHRLCYRTAKDREGDGRQIDRGSLAPAQQDGEPWIGST